MSLVSLLNSKNLLVGLGLIGIGIVGLKMLTGNVPPSRPTATAIAKGDYYDIGNVTAGDDIPVVGTLGYDWDYTEATGMMPTVAGIEGNIATPGVMNAYRGDIDVHGNRDDFPGQGHHYGWDKNKGKGHHYGWDKRPANAFYTRQRVLSY